MEALFPVPLDHFPFGIFISICFQQFAGLDAVAMEYNDTLLCSAKARAALDLESVLGDQYSELLAGAANVNCHR